MIALKGWGQTIESDYSASLEEESKYTKRSCRVTNIIVATIGKVGRAVRTTNGLSTT